MLKAETKGIGMSTALILKAAQFAAEKQEPAMQGRGSIPLHQPPIGNLASVLLLWRVV